MQLSLNYQIIICIIFIIIRPTRNIGRLYLLSFDLPVTLADYIYYHSNYPSTIGRLYLLSFNFGRLYLLSF